MARKGTNDQDHIVEAIKKGNRHYVWEQVKFVGTMFIRDIDERFLIFNKCFDKFDPERNNNFIHFYRKYLSYNKLTNDDREYSRLTSNRNVINILKSQVSTPTENVQAIIEDLKEWTNIDE